MRTAYLAAALQDPDWPGDAKIAGWWVWGQCCWIGSGWCDWFRARPAMAAPPDSAGVQACGRIPHAGDAGRGIQAAGKVPHASDAGMGIQAAGKVPHAGNAGMGIQAAGKVPHASDAGRGIQAAGKVPHASDAGRGIQAAGKVPHAGNAGVGIQAAGKVPHASDAGRGWLLALSARMARVRIVHGAWTRCLNHHYGATRTAVFLDPPYRKFAGVYGCPDIADQVETWCRANADLRVCLCGLRGDYDLPGWDQVPWSRGRLTYASAKTTTAECLWFSPACLRRVARK